MNKADILIVDDLPNNLRLLANLLEKEGYRELFAIKVPGHRM